MKMEENTVRYIAENLVNDVEKIEITKQKKGRNIIVHLSVAPDDMGRVIGKGGRVANAIRALLRASDPRRGRGRIILEID
ncbi:MAG: KH domain-containing protein [Chloroflexota bacterium]